MTIYNVVWNAVNMEISIMHEKSCFWFCIIMHGNYGSPLRQFRILGVVYKGISVMKSIQFMLQSDLSRTVPWIVGSGAPSGYPVSQITLSYVHFSWPLHLWFDVIYVNWDRPSLNEGHWTRNGRSSRGKWTAHNLFKSCHFDLLFVVFAPLPCVWYIRMKLGIVTRWHDRNSLYSHSRHG